MKEKRCNPQSEDNWPIRNSAASLIPTHSTYADRTHLVHSIGYRCTLIVFCLNRVIRDV